MTEKEMISLGSQLTRSYSDNSRAPFQAHLVVSSWGGLLKQRFDTVLKKHYLNWKGVKFVEDDFVKASDMARGWMSGTGGGTLAGTFAKYAQIQVLPDVAKAKTAEGPTEGTTESGVESTELSAPEVSFALNKRDVLPQHPNDNTDVQQSFTKDIYPNGEIIYLTSDSPNVLTELKPYSTYIVGGLVDKNRHKGICYKTATAKGFKTAKLPIGEYMEMQSRFVLATNHVVEVMLRWLECGDWGEAFMQVIPKRKGGKLKEEDE
jgi:tRNA (guanine9-N1)-methyltransferase